MIAKPICLPLARPAAAHRKRPVSSHGQICSPAGPASPAAVVIASARSLLQGIFRPRPSLPARPCVSLPSSAGFNCARFILAYITPVSGQPCLSSDLHPPALPTPQPSFRIPPTCPTPPARCLHPSLRQAAPLSIARCFGRRSIAIPNNWGRATPNAPAASFSPPVLAPTTLPDRPRDHPNASPDRHGYRHRISGLVYNPSLHKATPSESGTFPTGPLPITIQISCYFF